MTEVDPSFKLLTDAETKRVELLSHTIEGLEQDVEAINKVIHNTERGWELMEVKLKKERLVALTALTKSKLLLAKMAVLLTKNELNDRNIGRTNKLKTSADNFDSSTSTVTNFTKGPQKHRSSSTTSISRRASNISSDSRDTWEQISSSRSTSVAGSSGSKIKTNPTCRKGSKKSAKDKTKTTLSKEKSKLFDFTQETLFKNKEAAPSSKSVSPAMQSDVLSNVNGNGSFNHDDKNSISVSPLINNSATSKVSDIKTLTKSIIAEFDKSMSSNFSLNNEHTAKKLKINPVENISAYKQTVFPNVTNNSHVSTPTPDKIILPLHPRDPRTNPILNSKVTDITGTPIRHLLPQIIQSRNILTTKQIDQTREGFQLSCSNKQFQNVSASATPMQVRDRDMSTLESSAVYHSTSQMTSQFTHNSHHKNSSKNPDQSPALSISNRHIINFPVTPTSKSPETIIREEFGTFRPNYSTNS